MVYTPGDDSSWAVATAVIARHAQVSKYYDITIGPGRYLRKSFAVVKPIARARLYATALGVYEASINGQRVSDDLLTPGWTDYTKRVMVQTYDVTKLIHAGQNALGVVLGDGWYAGRLGWMGAAQYGHRPVFNAQLEITYNDGSMDVIATDSGKLVRIEIIGSDAQWGEIIDTQKAVKNWNQPAFDVSLWTNAIVEEHSVALITTWAARARPYGTRSAKNHPPRRRVDRRFRPESRRPCPPHRARPRWRHHLRSPRRDHQPNGSLYGKSPRWPPINSF